ncbi:hypothetical protein F7725_027415 [Dissostichus mawsoni]|uniref:Uncharacterized protein n=1 Tax=Dissostichus mawsoni TaxID=36200 RepID=A0A7J5XE24_DISMA|nr:hypothetical protein F7725_027415 [Dissostichus mawsoni]
METKGQTKSERGRRRAVEGADVCEGEHEHCQHFHSFRPSLRPTMGRMGFTLRTGAGVAPRAKTTPTLQHMDPANMTPALGREQHAGPILSRPGPSEMNVLAPHRLISYFLSSWFPTFCVAPLTDSLPPLQPIRDWTLVVTQQPTDQFPILSYPDVCTEATGPAQPGQDRQTRLRALSCKTQTSHPSPETPVARPGPAQHRGSEMHKQTPTNRQTLSGSQAKVNSPALGSGVMGAEMFFLRNPGTPGGFWLGPGRGWGEDDPLSCPPQEHTPAGVTPLSPSELLPLREADGPEKESMKGYIQRLQIRAGTKNTAPERQRGEKRETEGREKRDRRLGVDEQWEKSFKRI